MVQPIIFTEAINAEASTKIAVASSSKLTAELAKWVTDSEKVSSGCASSPPVRALLTFVSVVSLALCLQIQSLKENVLEYVKMDEQATACITSLTQMKEEERRQQPEAAEKDFAAILKGKVGVRSVRLLVCTHCCYTDGRLRCERGAQGYQAPP